MNGKSKSETGNEVIETGNFELPISVFGLLASPNKFIK
jgi:hypothetical protein